MASNVDGTKDIRTANRTAFALVETLRGSVGPKNTLASLRSLLDTLDQVEVLHILASALRFAGPEANGRRRRGFEVH